VTRPAAREVSKALPAAARRGGGARGAAGTRFAGSVSGPVALLAYAALSVAPLAAIALRSGRGFGDALAGIAEPRVLRALGFTLAQAALSTLAALAIGLPGAALVARYSFPGRRLLKSLSVLPFSVPSVLVVLAFVLFYGRSGYLNRFLMAVLGLGEPPVGFLYGFWGIVLAHGFYEFPVVLQTVGEVWERLPRERSQAARLLGAKRLRAFATGVLPSLAPSIAQAAALCFLLCFFSFAVVMVFGGLAGSTLEVEVYRRARIEGDPGGAAAMALAETAVALLVVVAVESLERAARSSDARGSASSPNAGGRLSGAEGELARPRGLALAGLLAYAAFLAVFFGGPVLSLLAQSLSVRSGPLGPGRPGLANFTRLAAPGSAFASALGATAATAVPAAFVATLLGCAGALALRRAGAAARAAAALPLAISGIVASLGWSLLLPRGGLALIPLVQALGVMPYVLKSVSAALSTLESSPSEAARTLGAGRLRAALGVDLPAVSPAILSALAFAFAAAAGDLNVALVLGGGGFETLPVYLYRLVAAHRFPEACAAGVVLAALTSAAFAAKERSKGHARR